MFASIVPNVNLLSQGPYTQNIHSFQIPILNSEQHLYYAAN